MRAIILASEVVFTVDRINHDQAKQIHNIMNQGGLCILPSDSSYVLTGDLRKDGISIDIDILLKRNGMKMSLAFGSLTQVSNRMNLSTMAVRFVEELSPRGLTFVAMPKSKAFRAFSENILHADGTVGIRLTRSTIETSLADYYPLPTTPIRDENNAEIGTAYDALEIVKKRMIEYSIDRPLAIIDNGKVPFLGRLSSVVKEEMHDGLWRLVIIREGAISFEEICNVASQCGYSEVIKKQIRKERRKKF